MKIRDADKDGLITTHDYKLVVQRYRDMGVSEEHLKKVEKFYALSWKLGGIVDDTTALTYDQAAANYAKSLDDISDDHTKIFTAHFEIVDTDENGEISFEEWVQMYKAAGVDIVHARPSFDAIDTNGDGVISKEEFVAYLEEFFFTAEDKLNSSILYGPLVDMKELAGAC